MKKLILIIPLVFFITTGAYSEEPFKNYCKDQGSWEEWHALLEKYPGDDQVLYLYALRLGLCSMVESGNISQARAVDIFEKRRGALIRFYEESEKGSVPEKEGT